MIIKVIVFGILIISGYYGASRVFNLEKHLTGVFQNFAESQGYSYSKEGPDALMETLKDTCFSRAIEGESHAFFNVVQGARKRGEIYLFNYKSLVGKDARGQANYSSVKTLAIYVTPDENLPEFTLRKRSTHSAVSGAVRRSGPNSVEIPGVRRFNERFNLQSKSMKENVAQVFSLIAEEVCQRKEITEVDCDEHSLMIELDSSSNARLKKSMETALWLIDSIG